MKPCPWQFSLFKTVLVLLALAAGTLRAQNSDLDVMSLSIEDLAKSKVFSASRHLEDARQAPSSVSIVTQEDITRYGWRTLADVVRSLRGFYTSYDRDYTYLGVRGFLRPGDYNSRILLMIDGHRINDNVYDSAPLGTEFPLDLDLIDHIEIVRGPSSSLFGTNAIFGVINVITRRPTSTTLNVSGEQSSFLGRKGSISAGYHKNRLTALVSGSLYRSDGQQELFYPEFSTVHSGIAENMDGDRASHAFADVEYGDWRVQSMYNYRTKMIPTASYGAIFNDPSTNSNDTGGYVDVTYHHNLSAASDLNVRAYYNWYRSLGSGAVLFGGTRVIGITKGTGHWAGTEATFGRQVGRHRITIGASYEKSFDIDQTNYALGQPPIMDVSHSPWLTATYGELELNLTPKIGIRAGARMDYYESFGSTFSPRVAFIYSPNKRNTLKYIFGHAFRAPNAYESYYDDSISIEKPSAPLDPEHIASHEVVYERNLRPWLSLTADAFYNDLKNLIDEQPDPLTGLNHFVNSGHDRGRGVEFEVLAKRSSGLSARASYSLSDAQDLLGHSTLANSPLHMVKLHGTLPVSRFAFTGAEFLYSASQQSYQGVTVPSRALTNLTLSSKPFLGAWEASASCYNAFNIRWFSPSGPAILQPEIRQDGRTYRFKITYRLHLERAGGKQ